MKAMLKMELERFCGEWLETGDAQRITATPSFHEVVWREIRFELESRIHQNPYVNIIMFGYNG